MKNRTITFGLIALLLAIMLGCQTNSDEPTPIFVTELFVLDDGREVVLTLEVTATPEIELPTPEPTIPIPESLVQLDVATTSGLDELDPQTAHNELTNTVIDNVYVGLTRVDAATDSVIGELAASWQTAEAGRIWTFDLRDDIYWVRGLPPRSTVNFGNAAPQLQVEVEQIRPIIADDVVASIRRVCSPDIDTPNAFVFFIIEGCERLSVIDEPNDDELATLGVRAISDTRLEVRLTEPAAYFLPMTALTAFRPIPADLLADPEIDWLDPEELVSSGPFIFSQQSDPEAVPLAITVLQRNPFWPGQLTQLGKPNFDAIERVNIYRYDSQAAAEVDYDKDLLDVIEPSSARLTGLLDSPAKPPPIITRSELFYLGFNFDSPAFGVPEVRRAFSAAIDREQLLQEVYDLEGVPMRHFAPPGVLFSPPLSEVGTGFNPDYAFFQLVNSGYGACRQIGTIRYLIHATDIALQHAETLIQMWVNELGCEASQFEIEQVQLGTLLARTHPDAGDKRPDIFDLGWVTFYPDAHHWYRDVLHCEAGDNRPKRPCSEIDDLIDQAATTFNSQERTALYRDIENSLFNQDGWTPVAPLYLRGTYQLEQDWISRIGDDETGDFIIRFGRPRFDLWEVNQELKDLERSQ